MILPLSSFISQPEKSPNSEAQQRQDQLFLHMKEGEEELTLMLGPFPPAQNLYTETEGLTICQTPSSNRSASAHVNKE